VRLVGPEGEPIGVVPMEEALVKAREAGLDLVEIAATANPPVCRIMNFGKYIYQQKKKRHDSKKKQKVTQVKEVKFRPNIDEHDYDFKKASIERFLEHGDKVKATIQFRGREMSRRENGLKVLERLITELKGKAVAESHPETLGNRMHQILGPVRTAEKVARPATRPQGPAASRE
jgi:translation initiation factor IF-3